MEDEVEKSTQAGITLTMVGISLHPCQVDVIAVKVIEATEGIQHGDVNPKELVEATSAIEIDQKLLQKTPIHVTIIWKIPIVHKITFKDSKPKYKGTSPHSNSPLDIFK
jgi:hypothetical protein